MFVHYIKSIIILTLPYLPILKLERFEQPWQHPQFLQLSWIKSPDQLWLADMVLPLRTTNQCLSSQRSEWRKKYINIPQPHIGKNLLNIDIFCAFFFGHVAIQDLLGAPFLVPSWKPFQPYQRRLSFRPVACRMMNTHNKFGYLTYVF